MVPTRGGGGMVLALVFGLASRGSASGQAGNPGVSIAGPTFVTGATVGDDGKLAVDCEQVPPSRDAPPPSIMVPLPAENRSTAGKLRIMPQFVEAAGQGFDDPQLGAARRVALRFAMDVWQGLLPGNVRVVVGAIVVPLPRRILARTYVQTMHRDFSGAPRAHTLYPSALANQLVQPPQDLNGALLPEMMIVFNANLDTGEMLAGRRFYYGIDGDPGDDIDFVSVALHELAHGLGFSSQLDEDGTWMDGRPSIFDRHLHDGPGGRSLADMTAAERAAAVVSGTLVFDGRRLDEVHGAPVPIYSPTDFSPGSSLSHWDPGLDPDELMEPRISPHPIHAPGLAAAAIADLGCEPGDPSAMRCTIHLLQQGVVALADAVCPRGCRRSLQGRIAQLPAALSAIVIQGDSVGCEEGASEIVRTAGSIVRSVRRRWRRGGRKADDPLRTILRTARRLEGEAAAVARGCGR